MGNAYRTLLLKFSLLDVDEKVSALLKVQEEFRRWATRWALDKNMPLPEHKPLKYFATWFIYGGGMLDWLKNLRKNGVKVKKMRPPLVFNAQLRLGKERDVGNGVLVDVANQQIRIRKWSGKKGQSIVLPLGDKAVKWILARVKEGGKLALVAVWIGASRRSRAAKLHVALIFRREVAPMRIKRLLVIDFNALHNGVSYAVVEEKRIVVKGVMRPNVSGILHLQKVASRLDAICAKKDKACEEVAAVKSRIWRLLRSWEDEAVKKLVRLAHQYKTAIIVDVPEDGSIRELKEGIYYAPEKKIFLNFGRIRKKLKHLAEWHGMPYREQRLYSTICPRCGAKMKEVPNRRVKCDCGFEANRDEVPALWAAKRFHELATPSFSFSFAVLRRVPHVEIEKRK